MILLHSIEELRQIGQPIFWAMGFFDGVHTGHQRVMREAREKGALCGVLTFAQHPLALLNPSAQPQLLTPVERQKVELIHELGEADLVLVLPFTHELSQLTAQQYLTLLEQHCRVAGISVGENWRFGRGGEGDTTLLREEGERRGFSVRIAPLLKEHGVAVSSRRIRTAVRAGELQEAERMLGHPFSICGEVEHGQHLAQKLGFPTANLAIPAQTCLPPMGVYSVTCQAEGNIYHGIANIGVRPSVTETLKLPRLEVHLLGYKGDLYGKYLSVQLRSFLRPEHRFHSLEELRRQIAKDIAGLC